MLFLLRSELYKITGYTAFRILITGYIVTLCSAAYIGDSFVQEFTKQSNPGNTLPVLSISEYWNALLWLGKFFHLYLGIVIIMLISNEWETRTMRQQIMSGLTEGQIILCKLFNASIFLIIPVILIIFLGLILGEGLGNMTGSEVTNRFVHFYLNGMGVLAFSAMLAFWMKKATPAILFLLGYYFIIESIFGIIIENYLPGYSVLLPCKAFSALADFEPDQEVLLGINNLLLLTVVYIIVFWYSSFFRLRKYDV